MFFSLIRLILIITIIIVLDLCKKYSNSVPTRDFVQIREIQFNV